MTKFRYALPLLAIAGCTGSQGETFLGTPGSPAWFENAEPQAIADYFGQRCASYGFSKGTTEMAQCIEAEAQLSKSENALGQQADKT
jgi:hypothetical protein